MMNSVCTSSLLLKNILLPSRISVAGGIYSLRLSLVLDSLVSTILYAWDLSLIEEIIFEPDIHGKGALPWRLSTGMEGVQAEEQKKKSQEKIMLTRLERRIYQDIGHNNKANIPVI